MLALAITKFADALFIAPFEVISQTAQTFCCPSRPPAITSEERPPSILPTAESDPLVKE
jgi:hypothetical protein